MLIYFLIQIFAINIIAHTTTLQPSWIENNLFNAGQHKAIVYNHSKQPSIFTMIQTLNRTFLTIPYIVLGLQGYQQNSVDTPTNDFGWKVEIIETNMTSFCNRITIYGQNMSHLYFIYFAIDTSIQFCQTQYYTFTENKLNNISTINSTHKSINLPIQYKINQSYPINHNIIINGFIAGFKTKPTSQGIYIALHTSINNNNSFTINITTLNQLTQFTFFRLSCDLTLLEYSDILIDTWFYETINQTLEIINGRSTITNPITQFKYRNYIIGCTILSFPNSTIEFLFQLGPPTIINHTQNYNYLKFHVFHLRLCLCPNTHPYYMVQSLICSDVCSNHYYNYTTQYHSTLICRICHSSCLSCTGPNQIQCLDCNSTLFRQINGTICSCIAGYYQSSTQNNSCIQCSILGCIECKQQQYCTKCNNSLILLNKTCYCPFEYYLNKVTTICKNCSQPCKQCFNSTLCLECSYQIQNNECIAATFCGDGIKSQQQQCDDGNLYTFDGCNSNCLIEDQHYCINQFNLSSSSSICYYNHSIQFTIYRIIKEVFENTIKIYAKVQCQKCNQNALKIYLQSYLSLQVTSNIQRMLVNRQLSTLNLLISSIKYNNGELLLSLTYTQDFTTLQHKSLKFVPSNKLSSQNYAYFYQTPQSIMNLYEPNNNIATIFYPPQQYQQIIQLSNTYLAILIMYWIVIVIGILAQVGVISWQLMNVYQLIWIALLGLPKIPIDFAGLYLYGKYCLGYQLIIEVPSVNCNYLLPLNINCNLINHSNFMLYLALLLIIIAIITKVIAFYQWPQTKDNLNQSSIHHFIILYSSQISITIFGILSVALGLCIRWTQTSLLNLLTAFILLLLWLISAILWIIFHNKLSYPLSIKQQLNKLVMIYYPLKWIITFCLTMIISITQSGLVYNIIVIVLFIILSIIIMLYQPYSNIFNNTRAIINCCTISIIQIIFLTIQFNISESYTVHSLIICALLIINLIISVILTIFSTKENKCHKQQIQMQIINQSLNQQSPIIAINQQQFQKNGKNLNYKYLQAIKKQIHMNRPSLMVNKQQNIKLQSQYNNNNSIKQKEYSPQHYESILKSYRQQIKQPLNQQQQSYQSKISQQ